MSRDAAKGRANSRIKRIRRTYPKLSQNSLHLRPKPFNGIQVRAVRRQIKGLRSSITEQLTYRLDMVSPEVVHYHNIAWPEGGNQNLFQIVQEFVRCCSTLKSRKRHCSIQRNRGQNGRGFWRIQRRMIYLPPAPFSPAIPSDHIDSAFIQENQARSLCCLCKPTPLFSPGLHIGDAPVLKRGSSSFFFDTPLPEFSGVRFLFQLADSISLRFLTG